MIVDPVDGASRPRSATASAAPGQGGGQLPSRSRGHAPFRHVRCWTAAHATRSTASQVVCGPVTRTLVRGQVDSHAPATKRAAIIHPEVDGLIGDRRLGEVIDGTGPLQAPPLSESMRPSRARRRPGSAGNYQTARISITMTITIAATTAVNDKLADQAHRTTRHACVLSRGRGTHPDSDGVLRRRSALRPGRAVPTACPVARSSCRARNRFQVGSTAPRDHRSPLEVDSRFPAFREGERGTRTRDRLDHNQVSDPLFPAECGFATGRNTVLAP